jgi:hypothetical protein
MRSFLTREEGWGGCVGNSLFLDEAKAGVAAQMVA